MKILILCVLLLGVVGCSHPVREVQEDVITSPVDSRPTWDVIDLRVTRNRETGRIVCF